MNFSLKKFETWFKWGFTKVVITRAAIGHLLYKSGHKKSFDCTNICWYSYTNNSMTLLTWWVVG